MIKHHTKQESADLMSDDKVNVSLLSYCDPGAQGSQVEVLNAEQPGVVLLRITGVVVRLVTFSTRVVFITAGVSVVWLTTRPGREGLTMFQTLLMNIMQRLRFWQFKCRSMSRIISGMTLVSDLYYTIPPISHSLILCYLS